MSFLKLFKKYRELEVSQKVFEKSYLWALDENRALQKELKAARAEISRLSAASEITAAAPKQRPIKVPHCATCPYHVRFNNAGKYAHRCNSAGCMIGGNDTRTSPRWCPLRSHTA